METLVDSVDWRDYRSLLHFHENLSYLEQQRPIYRFIICLIKPFSNDFLCRTLFISADSDENRN